MTQKLDSIVKWIAIGEFLLSLLPFSLAFFPVSKTASTGDAYPMLVLTFLIIGVLFISMRLVLFFLKQWGENAMFRFVISLVVLLAGVIIILLGTGIAMMYGSWKLYVPYFVIFVFYMLRFYFPIKGLMEG